MKPTHIMWGVAALLAVGIGITFLIPPKNERI